MPADLPTIASCPHCGTILLRTPRVLVHPMSGERERIRRALGGYWFAHARTRFDGRLHRCPGRERAASAGDTGAPRRHEIPQCAGGRRGPRGMGLVVAAASLLACAPARSQEGVDRWHFAKAEETRPVERPGGVGLPFPVGDLSLLFEDEPASLGDDGPGRPVSGLRSLIPPRKVAVAGGSCDPSEAPGQGSAPASWHGLELASGRYQVVDTIREDATGVVYLAHDRNLDSHVDVEVPSLSQGGGPGSTAEFVRAVRSLARLGHPHLVRVTEVGTYRQAPFVVAEHLAGGSLKFRRPVGPDGRPAPVAPETLGEWLPDIAAALDYLHSQGRVYREVSAASIRFDARGRAYLGGLAMCEAAAERMDAAAAGARAASPATLAPEVFEGASPDARSDQYALAATVYELLSGRSAVPPSADEPAELRRASGSISTPLSAAVHRGLSREPRDRYPDCSTFAAAVLAAARRDVPAGAVARVLPGHGGGSGRARASRARETGSGPSRSYLALGLACSTAIAVIGAKARRRPHRKRVTSRSSVPRQVVGKRLWRLASLIGGAVARRAGVPAAMSPPPEAPGVAETGRSAAIATSASRSPRAAATSPLQAMSKALSRRHELDDGPGRPRVDLAHNLLPVPYLSEVSALPAHRRRAAAAEPDGLASRRAS